MRQSEKFRDQNKPEMLGNTVICDRKLNIFRFWASVGQKKQFNDITFVFKESWCAFLTII